MPKTDYISDLDGEQIEAALEAIHDVVTPSNNGKVLCIVGGKIAAKSASEWGGGGYPEPTGTIPITANGTVNVKDYETAEVNVPNSYVAADEGKVVKNGALVAQTARATEIAENGTYDTTENNSVTVNVSGGGGGSAVVQPLNVTQNGTYNPSSGVDGFSPVTVNVSGGGNLVEIMHQGQVSDTSQYMTAYFDAGVNLSDYEFILVDLYKNGELIGSNGASPQSLPATFYITGDLSYTMKLASDSIACTRYTGSYYNLYVNVYGCNR